MRRVHDQGTSTCGYRQQKQIQEHNAMCLPLARFGARPCAFPTRHHAKGSQNILVTKSTHSIVSIDQLAPTNPCTHARTHAFSHTPPHGGEARTRSRSPLRRNISAITMAVDLSTSEAGMGGSMSMSSNVCTWIDHGGGATRSCQGRGGYSARRSERAAQKHPTAPHGSPILCEVGRPARVPQEGECTALQYCTVLVGARKQRPSKTALELKKHVIIPSRPLSRGDLHFPPPPPAPLSLGAYEKKKRATPTPEMRVQRSGG